MLTSTDHTNKGTLKLVYSSTGTEGGMGKGDIQLLIYQTDGYTVLNLLALQIKF